MLSGFETIHGIGVEIIEISKIKKALDKWPNNLGERLFTEYEIKYCQEFFNSAPHFAVRFAAKEAYIKALNHTWVEGMKWTDIEVQLEKSGRTDLLIKGKTKNIADGLGIIKNFVSLSHSHDHAIAQVILTKYRQEDGTDVS